MDTPTSNKRLPRKLVAFVSLTVVVIAVVGAWLGNYARNRARVATLSQRLDRDAAEFHGRRWTRPVLRGTPLDGNAADAQHRALDAIGPLHEGTAIRDAVESYVRSGGSMPAAVQQLLTEHAAHLEAVRASTRYSWSWNRPPPGRERAPDAFRRLRVASLLLARATSAASPAECLQLAADAVRFEQDGAPGGGILALVSIGVAIIASGPVLMRCTASASESERIAAEREFAVLAANPPPVSAAIEQEGLHLEWSLRSASLGVALVPRSRTDLAFVREWSRALDAWDLIANEAPRWRSVASASFPARFAMGTEADARKTAAHNSVLDGIWIPRSMIVMRDAAMSARLRALVVALAARVSQARSGALPTEPPPEAAQPELSDPFSGNALRWRRDATGTGAIVYSVGPNRRDDGAAQGSDDLSLRIEP